MAQLWRPIALAGVVAALIFTAALRGGEDEVTDAAAAEALPTEAAPDDAPDDDAPAQNERAFSGSGGKAFVPVAAAGPRPAPGTVAKPPVPTVDENGTQLLTGRVRLNVALTFDDGPHPQHTPEVLAILREFGIPATFCLVGAQVVNYPELVREIAADGHALCNHTVTHDTKLRHKDEATITDEIVRTDEAIVAAVPDAEVSFFRAPGGYFAKNVNVVAADHGLTPLGWSIDTEDWRKPGADAIRDRVLDRMHPGAVVLIHDGGGDRTASVAALPEIITALADEGYRFVVPNR